MPITVELQDMHSYSLIMPAIVAVFVAASIAIALVIIIKRNRKEPVRPKVEMPVVNPVNLKQKYVGLLINLEKKCRDNHISNRKAYQELSRITRHFVYESTGVKVHNYTLHEIEKTNITSLHGVIRECYVPEFAIDKNGDIYGSITRARKVIEEWN